MGEEMCAYLDGFGTKTFVYELQGNIYVINGVPLKTKKGTVIKSYAPFPKEFHFLDKDWLYICKNNETVNEILLTEKGFKIIKE